MKSDEKNLSLFISPSLFNPPNQILLHFRLYFPGPNQKEWSETRARSPCKGEYSCVLHIWSSPIGHMPQTSLSHHALFPNDSRNTLRILNRGFQKSLLTFREVIQGTSYMLGKFQKFRRLLNTSHQQERKMNHQKSRASLSSPALLL